MRAWVGLSVRNPPTSRGEYTFPSLGPCPGFRCAPLFRKEEMPGTPGRGAEGRHRALPDLLSPSGGQHGLTAFVERCEGC